MTDTSEHAATHKTLIRRLLIDGGSITPLEALREFVCYRLASRISDLRREGLPIVKTTEQSISRVTGKTVRFSRYFLKGNENNQSKSGEAVRTAN